MPETITARDANHHFARLLREVAAGEEFVVTRNGVPVARIVPEAPAVGKRKLTEAQEAAFVRMMDRMEHGDWGRIEHISCEQLHDEVIDARVGHRRTE